MKIISLLTLGLVCVVMSVIYALFGRKEGWKGTLARVSTYFTLTAFALVLSSLNSLTNALTIFIVISFALMIAMQSFEKTSETDTSKEIVEGLLSSLSILLLALSNLSLSGFNFFSTIGGLLLGTGAGLVVWAIKKYKGKAKILFTVIEFALIGLLAGVGYGAVVASVHSVSAVIMMIGGLLILVSSVMQRLAEEKKIIVVIADILMVVALTLMASSIYFY